MFPLFATGVIDTGVKFAAGVVDTDTVPLRLYMHAMYMYYVFLSEMFCNAGIQFSTFIKGIVRGEKRVGRSYYLNLYNFAYLPMFFKVPLKGYSRAFRDKKGGVSLTGLMLPKR